MTSLNTTVTCCRRHCAGWTKLGQATILVNNGQSGVVCTLLRQRRVSIQCGNSSSGGQQYQLLALLSSLNRIVSASQWPQCLVAGKLPLVLPRVDPLEAGRRHLPCVVGGCPGRNNTLAVVSRMGGGNIILYCAVLCRVFLPPVESYTSLVVTYSRWLLANGYTTGSATPLAGPQQSQQEVVRGSYT